LGFTRLLTPRRLEDDVGGGTDAMMDFCITDPFAGLAAQG
jgi:hypothetical protein